MQKNLQRTRQKSKQEKQEGTREERIHVKWKGTSQKVCMFTCVPLTSYFVLKMNAFFPCSQLLGKNVCKKVAITQAKK